MARMDRFELRTTDVAAARAFYGSLLGSLDLDIGLLPAAAAARGAVPHWLGHVGVEDVEGAVSAFVARGAARLGPTRATAAGGEGVILRDPGGAVLALWRRPEDEDRPRRNPVWHVLNTSDPARWAENYSALFGWRFAEPLDLGSDGLLFPFAWREGGPAVGALTGLAGRPGVHAHWLYFFAVDALEPAMGKVRAAGGLVIEPTVMPDGARIAVCDDPQGAAFGLWEARGYTQDEGSPCPSS